MTSGASPALSVVLPTYNAERYIAAAIESVLKQDFTDFELLVVDDGSTDTTYARLQSLATDPRVRLLSNETNIGLISTLHRAYQECRAPLIARMDADDICDPNRFRRQATFLKENPGVSIVGGAIRFFGNVVPHSFQFPINHRDIRAAMLFYCPLAHPALMFRRELIDQGLMSYDDDFRHAEDYHLWSRILLSVEAANLPEVVLNYRLHANQVSSDSSARQYAASLRVRQQMLKECGISPSEEELTLHESVILERCLPITDYMPQLATWFRRLEAANTESGYWEPAALHRQLRAKFLETSHRVGSNLTQLAENPLTNCYISKEDIALPIERFRPSVLARTVMRLKVLLSRISKAISQ